MIQMKCPLCGEAMEVPDCLVGMREECPACHYRAWVNAPHPPTKSRRRRRKVALTAKQIEAKAKRAQRDREARRNAPASERQLAFAEVLGLTIPLGATVDEASWYLTRYDQVKHYIYGLIIAFNVGSAADLGIPQEDVESLALNVVHNQREFADEIGEIVRDRCSYDFLKDREAPAFERMLHVIKERWGQYFPPRRYRF